MKFHLKWIALVVTGALAILGPKLLSFANAGSVASSICSSLNNPASVRALKDRLTLGPHTVSQLTSLATDCRDSCSCRPVSASPYGSFQESAVICSRGGKDILGLRVSTAWDLSPRIDGFWTIRSPEF